MIDWNAVDTVFLDMDGTLLDLHFDNHFWLEHLPVRYAQKRGISRDEANAELFSRYRSLEGTLKWYCVDHWSRELGLDIALLKEEVNHLIRVHPHVIPFLEALAKRGKRRVLATNAHQKSIAIKLQRTPLGAHFDRIICAHDLGAPKESHEFWPRLNAIEPFDRERSLLVDDNPSVLESAQRFGLRWLLAVLAPDSQAPPREPAGFPSIHHFADLLPDLQAD